MSEASNLPDDTLIETATLARMVGTTIEFWENLRTSGRGPRFCKIGRLVRYRKSDVDAWLAEQTFTSTLEAKNRPGAATGFRKRATRAA